MRSLDRLLSPESIVVFGAAQDPGRIGGRPFDLARRAGYRGRMAGIHPRIADVQGFPCYSSLAAVPFLPDLAVIALGADKVLVALQECAERGVRAAVVFAAGFAEASDDGVALQRRMIELVAANGILVLGPNTLGFANLRHRAFATFASAFLEHDMEPGGVALIGQSGGACMTVYNAARERGVGFGSIVMTGNEACLGFVELATAALNDRGTTTVLGYIEGLEEDDAMRTLAQAAVAADKPLILYKVGDTPAGASAVLSHTARITGDGRVFRAALAEINAIRADGLEEMAELAYLSRFIARSSGRRGGVVTASGAIGAILADKLVGQGAALPPLSPRTRDLLARAGMTLAAIDNPVDISANIVNSRAGFQEVLRILLHCEDIDFLVFFATGAVIDMVTPILLEEQARSTRLLCVMLSGRCATIDALEGAMIPVYRDIARGALALARFGLWHHRKREPKVNERPAPPAAPMPGCVRDAHAESRTILDEHESKSLLAGFGIATPVERVVTNRRDALRAAEAIGLPVVMKVLSANAVHKTELGGVRLNVAGPQVEATYDELASVTILEGTSNAVLVQQQAKHGIELLVSVSFNTGFGAVMTVAAGGTASELADDSAHGLLPLTETRAQTLLQSLRCYPLLTGYRGSDPADRVALVETLIRLSDMSLSLREWLTEIEINPIIASASGAIAVDAVIKLRKP